MANDYAVAGLINETGTATRAAVQAITGSGSGGVLAPAKDFLPVTGATLGTGHAGPEWLLAHGATGTVATDVDLTSVGGWTTATLSVLLFSGGGTGNATISATMNYLRKGGGSVFAPGSQSVIQGVVAIPANSDTVYKLAVGTVSSSFLSAALAAPSFLACSVSRLGSDAGDTYSFSIRFLGITLDKAS